MAANTLAQIQEEWRNAAKAAVRARISAGSATRVAQLLLVEVHVRISDAILEGGYEVISTHRFKCLEVIAGRNSAD